MQASVILTNMQRLFGILVFLLAGGSALQAQARFYIPMNSGIQFELFDGVGSQGQYLGFYSGVAQVSNAKSITIFTSSGTSARTYDLELTGCDIIEVHAAGPACRPIPVLTPWDTEEIGPGDPTFDNCFYDPASCWPTPPWEGGAWSPPPGSEGGGGGGYALPFTVNGIPIIDDRWEPEDGCAVLPSIDDFYVDTSSVMDRDTVSVIIWYPRLTLSSFLGHVTMTVGDSVFSFEWGGMKTYDTTTYYSAQLGLRGGMEIFLWVPRGAKSDIKRALREYPGKYTFVINCGTPVQYIFNRLSTAIPYGSYLLPTSVGAYLILLPEYLYKIERPKVP